ncbi:DUF333 domain-containing protein [Novosphingobium capsulatum]|uniref:DUF333 domain-containing protein n=1 Tax=Novosphingobium capsulatum TaxID=13688 RepID=UPI000A8D19E9|nr:DUF333 domain-containing protein [Novosphingobium capsulatum]
MRLWVFVAMGSLVCFGVPALILNSAEAFGQMPDGHAAPGICFRTGGVAIVVNGGSYCRLQDGRLIGQRLLFRRRHRPAVMPNPASAYCEQNGGRLEMVNGPGGQAGYCHLPNGAVVEEWALFRGR